MNKVSVTTAEMLNAFGALQNLSSERLPAKCSYTVARLISRLKPEHEIAEAKRVELVRKHGSEQEDGSVIVPEGWPMTNFIAEFKEIEEVVLELEVPLLDIGHFGDLQVQPVILLALEKFIA